MPAYIDKKTEIWSGVTDPSHTDTQTTEYRATQLVWSLRFKLSHAIWKCDQSWHSRPNAKKILLPAPLTRKLCDEYVVVLGSWARFTYKPFITHYIYRHTEVICHWFVLQRLTNCEVCPVIDVADRNIRAVCPRAAITILSRARSLRLRRSFKSLSPHQPARGGFIHISTLTL